MFHAHLHIPAETSRSEDESLLGPYIHDLAASLDLNSKDGALGIGVLAPDPGDLGIERHLGSAFLGYLLEGFGIVLAGVVGREVRAVRGVSATDNEDIPDLGASLVDHPVQSIGRFLRHDLNELRDVEEIAALQGILNVLIDAVLAEVLFLTKMHLVIPRGVAAAVDDGVSAVDGHFLEDDGFRAVAGRFRRSRKARKP
ncbi:MAG: hypothetical protein A4E61_00294 [Syntrophorhabdus sp. PtaB.Bin184]|nr:MAG: hypothetical protein A4E61_00294 [Syntrophorhabdus sp. PtaB.Bin184]